MGKRSSKMRAKISHTRFDIWKEQKLKCAICGKKIENYLDVSIDHIVPLVKGGGNERSNLQVAHKICNNRKGEK
jgi:5-methylcytosine-specific restriction enzyme A